MKRRSGTARRPGEDTGELDELIAELDQESSNRMASGPVPPKGWIGAHTREKVLAAAADRFVVIADSSKPVEALHPPVPLELLAFGLRATLRLVAPASLRDIPLSPDGGVIADYLGRWATRPPWPPGSPRRPASSGTACSPRGW